MTQAANLAALGSSGVSLGMKNRVINGAMTIDQRNAGASITQTTGDLYPVDRFRIGGSVTSKFTAQQNAGSVTPPVGFTNYVGITSSSAYAVGTGDYFFIDQPIEGFNTADLGWGTANAKTVTLSAWVYSSLTGTFGGSLKNNTGTQSYPFTYSIGVANTWTQISVTIPGSTTGSWLTTNGVGIRIVFGLGVGATYSGTTGTWGSANYLSATGAVSVVGTSGATFYITGVQLEAGTTATNFDFRSIGTELALCQRYYYKNVNNAQAGFYGTINSTGTQSLGSALFKVSMRAAPTIILFDGGSNTSGTCTQSAVADAIPATASSNTTEGFGAIIKTTGNFTTAFGYPILAGYTANAEL